MKKLLAIIMMLMLVASPIYANYEQYEVTTNSDQTYIGVTNTGNLYDNGTRVYLMPKQETTVGLGGALKIFGDAYNHDDWNYRDIGIYFHANQGGDVGSNNTGVFWINGKANGKFQGKNPDIAIGFQDGQYVASRYSLINNNPLLIIGPKTSQVAKGTPEIKAEVQGNMAFRNNDYIQWRSLDGTRLFGIGGDTLNRFKISSIGGMVYYTNGQLRMESDQNKTDYKHALVTSTVKTAVNTTQIDATGTNRVKLTDASTISSIKGVDGQKITVLFKHNDAKVVHGQIKLQNGADYQGGMDSTLVLENIEGTWYELSRSTNHP